MMLVTLATGQAQTAAELLMQQAGSTAQIEDLVQSLMT